MDEPLTLSFTGRVEAAATGGAETAFYGHFRFDPAAMPARIDPATREAVYAVADPDAVLLIGGEPVAPDAIEIRVGNDFAVRFPGNPIVLPFDVLAVTVTAGELVLEAGVISPDTGTLVSRALPGAPFGFVTRDLRSDLLDLRDFDGSFATALALPGTGALQGQTTRLAISEGVIGAGLAPEAVRTVAHLYEAALDRDGAIDAAGLNFWVDAREAGLSQRDLASAFLAAPEFEAAFGPVDSRPLAELVETLFENVLDRSADPDGLAFWQARAAEPDATAEALLIAFAASAENAAGSPEIADLVEVAPGIWDFL